MPICDHRGVIINDPILLKIADDRFWLSIADSDIVLFARAVAAERKLNVRVFEPDVSPLAIQGPKPTTSWATCSVKTSSTSSSSTFVT